MIIAPLFCGLKVGMLKELFSQFYGKIGLGNMSLIFGYFAWT